MIKLIFTLLLLIPSVAPVGKDHETLKPSAVNIIFQSIDGGKTWQDISAGLPENLPVRCVYADNQEVLLGSEIGVYRSQVSSKSPLWMKEFLLIDEKIKEIFPGKFGRYVLSFSNGFYRELANTGLWLPVYTSLNDNRVRSVMETLDGSTFVSNDSGIFKSIDNGKTWKQVLVEDQVMSISEYDGIMISGGNKGLWRSTDKGEHWDRVLCDSGSIRKTGFIDGHFVAITNGKRSWKEITTDGIGNSLLSSIDGGKTWTSMDESLSKGRVIYDPNKKPKVQFINDIEQIGVDLFCSMDSGIYHSSNHGKSWELVLPSTEKLMFNFAVSGKVIYAIRATLLGGC